MKANASAMEFAKMREHFAGAQGKEYWRSLDELAQTAEFQALVEQYVHEHYAPADGAAARAAGRAL